MLATIPALRGLNGQDDQDSSKLPDNRRMKTSKGLIYLVSAGMVLAASTMGWAQAPDRRAPGERPADRAPAGRPDRAPEGRPDRAPGERPADRAPERRRPGGRPPIDRPQDGRAPVGLLGVIDRNGNGTIEADEIDMAVVSLRKLDRNKDGKVTRDEIGRTDSGSRTDPGSSRRFRGRLPSLSSMDKDGDGKINKEEAPERMRENFERTDTNGDGFIDSKEFDAVLQRIRGSQRPGQRPSRRPGGQEPGEGEGGSDQPRRPAAEKDTE